MVRRIFGLLVVAVVSYSPPSLAAISADLNNRLDSCEPHVAITAAEEIVKDPGVFKDPLQFFAPIVPLFRHGKKDEAVFWYYAAQLRTRDQIALANANQGLLMMGLTMAMAAVGHAIDNYAFQNASNFIRIIDRVTAWDKRMPNPYLVLDKEKFVKVDLGITQLFGDLRDKNSKFIQERASKESPAWLAAMETRFQAETIDHDFVELRAKLATSATASESKARLAAPVVEMANPKLFSYCRTHHNREE